MTFRKGKMKYPAAGNALFAVLMFAVTAFLLWKCRYGFANWDESFYLATPYRLLQGDALFADEWHLSQMSSVLLLPFVYVYMMIFKTTAGMALAFRYIYIAVQAAASVFVYARLKKYSALGAMLSSLSFFLYAPFSINAMSYNSLGITCLIVSCLLLCTSEKKRRFEFFISGIFYAAAVLCCPYLAVLLPLLIIADLIGSAASKRKGAGEIPEIFEIKNLIWFVFGIAVPVILFLTFVLSRASLNSIIDAFSGIFDDPEHRSIGIINKLFYYTTGIFSDNSGVPAILYIKLGAYILTGAFLAAALFDRGRQERRKFYLTLFSVLAVALAFVYTKGNYINFIMFPLNVFALACFVIFRDDCRIKRLFVTVWLPGMIYSFCLHLSSNQLFYAISSASTVALVGSLAIIAITFSKVLKEECSVPFKCIISVFAAGLFVWQLGSEAYFRYSQVFWEDGINGHDFLIEEGYEKGIYVTEIKYDKYGNALKAKSEITEKYGDKKSLLCLSENTWLYLVYEEYENAAFSAWLSGISNTTVERLETYYSLRENKKPDLIYVESANMQYGEKLAADMGYIKDTLSNGDAVFVRR